MAINQKKAALQLLSRYSLPPNTLGYCGKGSATEKFKSCIIYGKCETIDEEVSHFIVLYPYLKTISALSHRDIFDYKVAECFWLGNELIGEATIVHYELLLKNFQLQGVPASFVEELRVKQPIKFIPFHLFQVLHVGVGKSSGAVPFNLDTINNCMIRWGKVTELNDKTLKIILNSLKTEGGKFVLYQKTVEVAYSEKILKGIKLGDIVTVHWNIVNNILNPKETKNLEYWSYKTLEVINSDPVNLSDVTFLADR
jgi:hypothetical protein